MLKQSLVNNGIRYDAGCSEDKVCPQNTASVHTYNCKSDRCNKKANAAKPCELGKLIQCKNCVTFFSTDLLIYFDLKFDSVKPSTV